MREGGRGGRGRGEATRVSRRGQGLPPEETPSLEESLKAAKKVKAEKKKAAQAQKKKSGPDAPVPVQDDAHQVSEDGATGDGLDADGGKSGPDEPAKASAGGAGVEEPRTEARVSDSSSPVQDAEPMPDLEAEEKLRAQVPALPPVPEDESVQAAEPSATSEDKTTSEPVPSQTSVQSRSQLGTSDGGPSMEAAKTYAEMQVARWEQARPEQALPPNVEYVWPDSRPDSLPWLTATLATSQYLRSRMTAADRVETWVAELRLDRRDLAAAQDLTTLEIPVGILEPWECVTILQTLLLEAGFGFVNLIPSWTTTVVSEVAKNLVQGLVGDVQTLLTVEFVEFRYFFRNTLESLFQSCWTCLLNWPRQFRTADDIFSLSSLSLVRSDHPP